VDVFWHTVYNNNRRVLFVHSHSPFRQHKTKDKSEIDNMTLNMVRYRMLMIMTIWPHKGVTITVRVGFDVVLST